MPATHSTPAPTPAPRRPARRPLWRRALRLFIRTLLVIVVALVVAATAVYVRYRGIVDPGPVRLKTSFAPGERGRWVNPFLGTGGFPWVCGNNFPGSMVPFGMVRLGPETSSLLLHRRALNTSGYFYGDPTVLGFSHTRLNGTGATDGGHFLVTPSDRPLPAGPRPPPPELPFSHAEELAFPGYYAVRLPRPGVLVELTATPRVGVHRYTFDAGTRPRLVIDVMNALGGRRSREGQVRVLPEAHEIEGTALTFGSFAQRYGGLRVYFVARTEPPFSSFSTWNDQGVAPSRTSADGNQVGVDLGFDPTSEAPATSAKTPKPPITLKLAISHVSVANARANLDAEAAAADFDALAAAARQSWEDKLGLITVTGGTERERTNFHTALCRAFQMPTVFNDANGEYLGFDHRVHRVTDGRHFTDLSLWDTFRTTHPLYTLIAPTDQRDMVASLLRMEAEGGWLPRWPAGAGYSNSMLGTPADIVIAETWLKGIRDFDVARAYAAMKRTALAPTPPGAAFSGRRGIEAYLAHRFCPRDLVPESVSRTFEYGWADDAISRLAEALGHSEDAALLHEHSRHYTNLWNPRTQYFQPRYPDGRFHEAFKPLLLTYLDRTGEFTKDYVEGSALQWRWGAPYDADGMISLFRSRESFVAELDSFFARSDPARGAWNPGPYYWHGNQPDIHAAFLFNRAGRPDLTRRWVRWILDHKYGPGYDGLDGNDDGGTLSAWYVFAALGLYPMAGSDRYELAAPLFPRADLALGTNHLVILAENHAPNREQVREIWLNATKLDRTWIRHAEIAAGGTLRFIMTDEARSQ